MREWMWMIFLAAGCSSNPDQVSGLRPVTPGWPDFEATSTSPKLVWEAFPTPDMPAQDAERVEHVTYDLRVLDTNGAVVYSRDGLRTAWHTLDISLASKYYYLWTVRAHFTLGGTPRVTQWTEPSFQKSRSAESKGRVPYGVPIYIP